MVCINIEEFLKQQEELKAFEGRPVRLKSHTIKEQIKDFLDKGGVITVYEAEKIVTPEAYPANFNFIPLKFSEGIT